MYKWLAPAMAALVLTLHAQAASPADRLTCSALAPTLEQLNRPLGNFDLDPAESTRWLRTSAEGPRRGVVMVIHGLNIRPSKMDSIAHVLNDAGYDVLRVALSGHRGSLAEMFHVTHEHWLKEAYLSYCVAREDALTDGVPVSAIGYSLGGALIENILNDPGVETPAIERAVLFAPAIALTPFTKSGELLNMFHGGVVPSQIIGDYRANDWFTLQAYNGVIDTTQAVRYSGMLHSNIPTLVFGDSCDELVDTKGVKELAHDNHLDAWTFQGVKIASARPFQFKLHHVIIDEDAMGEEQWQEITEAMLRNLDLR